MLVIRTHLAEMGFQIIEAVNGKEAVKKYAENEVDLVFMDLDFRYFCCILCQNQLKSKPTF